VKDGIGTADPDYAVAQVLNAESGEQVAVMRGRVEPAEFGRQVWALMRWYNLAYCVPDADSFGVAVIEELLRQQVPLDLLYRRQRGAHDQNPTALQYLGFVTTTVSKPQVISDLQLALRQRVIHLHDPISIAECRTFVYRPNGTTSAEQGAHDDTVMALALAVMGIKQSYLIRREREAAKIAPEIRSYRR
jgi:phage terminase large subunit